MLAVAALVLAGFGSGLTTASALTNCTVSATEQQVDAEEQQMLDLINQYRLTNGRNTLALSADATRAATWFAVDMATFNYFPPNHVDRLNRDIPTRLTQCDVPFVQFGENIASGNATAEATFEQWRTSPTHNAIMLTDGITHAGIARAFGATSTFGWYWVLDVTNPGATTTTSSTTTTSTSTTTTSTTSTTTTLPPTTTTSSTSTTVPVVFCGGLQATIVGTSGSDVLIGTEGPDVIAGLGGDDQISGLGGDDVICGGEGADRISAGGGNDTVYGEGGSDTITGGDGDDTLFGGPGSDRIDGGPGTNTIDGGPDPDVCTTPNTNCSP